MNDDEILEHIKRSAKDDLLYFSNKNKEARERWVVSQFLSVTAIQHEEEELQSLEQSSKVDVQFHDAAFQVKELPDPDLRRGKMYKDVYNSIKEAKTLKDVSFTTEARDIPPIANMFELVYRKAEQLARSEIYNDEKSEIDLLVYITRSRASLIQSHELNEGAFLSMGWRSVSCVNTKQAVVLFSSPTAPKFIRAMSQQLISARG